MLSIYKGDDQTVSFSITDSDDVIINLSGGQLDFYVTDWQGTNLFTKSSVTAAEITVTNVSGGEAEVYMVPADTSTLAADTYIYYMKYTDSTGKIYTVTQDDFVLLDLGSINYIRNRIRTYTGDEAELNVLIQAQECTDEDLTCYIQQSIDFFNNAFYNTSYTISNFPSKGTLIDGTILQILQGKSILSARNTLTYNDAGGITVQDYDVYGRYVNLFNVFWRKYLEQVKAIKRSINVNACLGGVDSPMGYHYDRYF